MDIYLHGQTAVPSIAAANAYQAANPNNTGASPFDNSTTDSLYTGYDPDAHAYPVQVGEVIEIILLNEAGYANTYDVHPWHAHGGHYYDIGSGPGMYDLNANEAKLQSLNDRTGFVPTLRDTTMLYRWPANNSVVDPEGTVSGWRGWRIRITDPGVWMIHCHSLQHMVMGMQTVWVMGDAAQITGADISEENGYTSYGGNVEYEPEGNVSSRSLQPNDMGGYLQFGGSAYGNVERAPIVNHYFS